MSLPSNLRYQSKTESAPARRFLTQIQPQGDTSFSQGETITLNLPTRSNTCLIPSESYLKGQLNIVVSGATTATTLESCGFHAFVQRVRVFHGSNLLEDIDNYHQLAKVLHDFQAPEDTVKGRLSVTAGTNPDFSVLQAASAGDVLNAASVNRGRALGALGAASHPYPFAINLISLVGSLCGDKYLPLFELSAAPLRCEIVLQSSAARALMNLGGTISSFNVTGVNYCGEYLEIPDAAVASIKAASSSPMQMVVPSYRSYTNSATIPAASQTEVSFPFRPNFRPSRTSLWSPEAIPPLVSMPSSLCLTVRLETEPTTSHVGHNLELVRKCFLPRLLYLTPRCIPRPSNALAQLPIYRTSPVSQERLIPSMPPWRSPTSTLLPQLSLAIS